MLVWGETAFHVFASEGFYKFAPTDHFQRMGVVYLLKIRTSAFWTHDFAQRIGLLKAGTELRTGECPLCRQTRKVGVQQTQHMIMYCRQFNQTRTTSGLQSYIEHARTLWVSSRQQLDENQIFIVLLGGSFGAHSLARDWTTAHPFGPMTFSSNYLRVIADFLGRSLREYGSLLRDNLITEARNRAEPVPDWNCHHMSKLCNWVKPRKYSLNKSLSSSSLLLWDSRYKEKNWTSSQNLATAKGTLLTLTLWESINREGLITGAGSKIEHAPNSRIPSPAKALD